MLDPTTRYENSIVHCTPWVLCVWFSYCGGEEENKISPARITPALGEYRERVWCEVIMLESLRRTSEEKSLNPRCDFLCNAQQLFTMVLFGTTDATDHPNALCSHHTSGWWPNRVRGRAAALLFYVKRDDFLESSGEMTRRLNATLSAELGLNRVRPHNACQISKDPGIMVVSETDCKMRLCCSSYIYDALVFYFPYPFPVYQGI